VAAAEVIGLSGNVQTARHGCHRARRYCQTARVTLDSHVGAARTVLAGSPLVDGHNDLAWAIRSLCGHDLDRVDVGSRQTATRTDIPRLREGGVGAQFWSVYVPSTLSGGAALTATLEQVDFVHAMVGRYPDQLALTLTADEVESAFAGGRIASLIGAEGGHSIDCSMGALRMLFALGVRYMTLTHNDNTPWADSATDARRSGGLSAFGREVVLEMNRLGMLVDLSHVSTETMSDALDTSEAPVICSHSSCRELVDHPRNVPDTVLRRLADQGGVCMVTFVPDFVSSDCAARSRAVVAEMERCGLNPRDWEARGRFEAEYAKVEPIPRATLAQVADHVEHVREVAGIDHVGIGGDFDGCDALPDGLDDVGRYPWLIAELLDRGWSASECGQVANGNILRVMREAESTARALIGREASRATIATDDGGAAVPSPLASSP
jgi:membrane dipeptidase